MVVAMLLGVLTWSLLEYGIHRFLGHGRAARKNPFGKEHTAHHSRGDYFAPWWKKAASALGYFALVGPLAVLVGTAIEGDAAAGMRVGLAYGGGLVGFYLCYEVLHRLLHVWAGVGPYARWARRHHFHHHLHDPSTNHGVTSPLWDIVFRTWRRPTRVNVPPKLAMRWLRDPASGEVWPRHAADYTLRR